VGIIACCIIGNRQGRAEGQKSVKIDGIFKELSSRYSGISVQLHVIRETYRDSDGNDTERIVDSYIEFKVPKPVMDASNEVIVKGTVVTPENDTTDGMTAAKKLADLELIRSDLSDEDYRKKREEIISQV